MDYNKLRRVSEQLRDEIIQSLQKSVVIYCPIDCPRIITTQGNYKISFEDSADGKKLKRRWDVWFEQIIDVIKTDRDLYSNISSIHQGIQYGWCIHDNDLDAYINNIKLVFDDLFDLIDTKVELSVYKEDYDSITINIASKQVVLNIIEMDKVYDGIKTIVDNADLPSEVKTEINEMIEDGKANPGDEKPFRKLLSRIHNGLSTIAPELSLIGLLATPFL